MKLKAYWPDKGLEVRSGPHQLTTFDRDSPSVSFSVVTDTHEDTDIIERLNQAIDWDSTDFLVHAGDAFHSIDDVVPRHRAGLVPRARGSHTAGVRSALPRDPDAPAPLGLAA